MLRFSLLWQVSWGLDLLDEMQQRGTKLSPYAFNPFIRDFARWGMHEEVLLQCKSNAKLFLSSTWILVCRTWSSRYFILLRNLHENNLQAYICHVWWCNQAFEMMEAMIRLGVQPSVVTYSTLINCCVKLGDVSCRWWNPLSLASVSLFALIFKLPFCSKQMWVFERF